MVSELTKGEQARADEYGINFTINDANLDLQTSLAAVDDYVAQNVDVLNFTPVNEEASGPKITEVAATGKPIICESSPTDGCTTLVSIDDYAAGFKVGVWAGEYVNANMGGQGCHPRCRASSADDDRRPLDRVHRWHHVRAR